jgi:DNA-binding NarL/FixJ family response regulator
MKAKVRVLLVDDVADLRTLYRVVLESDGAFRVVGEAGDGEDAIQAARTLRPDLVLLDLAMPKMDGLQALPEILRAAPEARVVILSGFDEHRLGETARRLGAHDYIEKGMAPADLVERLRGLDGIREILAD